MKENFWLQATVAFKMIWIVRVVSKTKICKILQLWQFFFQKRLDNVQGQFLRVSRWIHNQIGPADWWSRFWRSSFPDEIQDDYEIKLWKPYLNSRIRQDSILCFPFLPKVAKTFSRVRIHGKNFNQTF